MNHPFLKSAWTPVPLPASAGKWHVRSQPCTLDLSLTFCLIFPCFLPPFPPWCPSSVGLLYASDGGHTAPPHSGSGVPVPAAPGTGLWGRKACPTGADSHSAGKERPTQRSTTNITSHCPSFQNPPSGLSVLPSKPSLILPLFLSFLLISFFVSPFSDLSLVILDPLWSLVDLHLPVFFFKLRFSDLFLVYLNAFFLLLISLL